MNMPEEPAKQATSGSDAFISYASMDEAVANSIVESLESQGLKCWMAPRDVKPGAQYADAIVRAINEAKALVLVMSGSAVDSAHVAREVERGASKRKAIIPFRIDNAPLNPELEYFLSNSQWIEVPKLGMPAALAKLKEAVGQGGTTSAQAVAAGKGTNRAANRVAMAVAIVVALGVAGGLGLYLWKSNHGAHAPSVAAITDKSIAVLPFADMSEKKDQEYFADGMAEEIIDLLVKVPGLKVIGRTSSFQFKGRNEDLRVIGAQLGVSYLLEGSVRESGDRLRVTAQLIDSRDGTHLFSQTYDRNVSDVLKMQDEIAVQVVRALQIEVTAGDFVSRPVLRSTEAYTEYLKGLHAFNRYDQQGFEQAVTDFQRALDLDPSFADASVWLSITYLCLEGFGFMPPAIAFERARHSAELALKMDPNLARAHTLLGQIHLDYDWDWPAAERELKLARTLAPNELGIMIVAFDQARIMGRWDDALKLVNARLDLDPLFPDGYLSLSTVQLFRGRLAEAEAAARRILEISPTFAFAHYHLGVVLLTRGDANAALREFMKEPLDGARLKGSAMAYFALGRRSESDTSLAEWLKDPATRQIPISLAELYAFRRESDEALKWLDVAYEQKDTNLYLLKTSWQLKSLEGDPRYKAFLKKMNLPE
jgi:TolB-like protein